MTNKEKLSARITSAFTFFLGVILTIIATGIFATNQFGRMANHKHCNMSLESLGGMEASNIMYYQHKYLENHD